ncbi:MAG: type IV pilus twitching motility protein PilT [Cyanothece sp. SIO1E1]|nr:type IV pilus twitching motility protein PilT [Cyanothece sp. SIO1E1]
MTELHRSSTPPPPPPARPAADAADPGSAAMAGARQQMQPQATSGAETASSPSAAAGQSATTVAPGSHRPSAPPPVPPNARVKVSSGAPTLEQLVREAFDKGYSDVHLGISEIPRFRNRGEMQVTDYPVTDEQTFLSWLAEVLTPKQIEGFRQTLDFDGAVQYEFVRIRINIFDSIKGSAMVLRLIPLKILTIEELGLPLIFKDICHYNKGMVLVTGPTGSGKSTTLAAMVEYINTEMSKNIISIEDPIEFVHQSRKSLIKQREVGINTYEFGTALRASLREDPDIIMIGEMRDRETVSTAIKAAQTGHLVFGTLHTNSAVKTIERLINLYEPEEQEIMRLQVAESLLAVNAQTLVRTTDGKRASVHEIMIATDAIKDYVKRGDIEEVEALIPKCNLDGMCTMNQSLYALYESGRITEETALEASPRPNEMAQILRGRI